MKRFFQFTVFLFVFGNAVAQQTEYVDFKRVEASVFVDQFEVGEIFGTPYKIEFYIVKSTDSIYINAVDMKFDTVYLNNEKVDFTNTGREIVIFKRFKKGNNYNLHFNFYAKPKKAMYFFKKEDGSLDQLWTQGQGKYTSHWLPSIDDVNDKIEFNLTFNTPKNFKVLSNGKLRDSIVGLFGNWFFGMQKPMSSYLVALAVGSYEKKSEVSRSGIPLEYYYYPKDSLKVEPTYRYTKQMFDFLEDEIGVPYPWQNYKQVPVKDFLYSGMENTSLTIFSDSFVVDSIAFQDKNYVTVNAHELAHQWFGNLVTATSGTHHWLQEGFATYYALLAERAIFGDDHYYWQLFENAQELIDQERSGKSTSLLNPKSSSTTFYKKGAWALHVLRERVGDSAFKLAVKAYLEKHQFANVETSDFISEVENTSGQDLSAFVSEWLVGETLPEDIMVTSLKQSAFLQEYFMVDCETYTSKCKDYLSSYISDKAKVKVIRQIPDKIEASAFQNSLEVRQALARYVDKIPVELKPQYESLLDDESYLTIENTLYHLWANFPQDRIKYLQKTKDIIGFNDYNVRLLWLALHLNTIAYQPEKKQAVLSELIGYSLPEQHFELRINAFNYLKLLDAFEIQSIKSLLDATTHPNWRFSKFAKDLLLELEQNDSYKVIINTLRKK
nr:M1 family metallopeptidase [uncultured Psychroserpens sp.]